MDRKNYNYIDWMTEADCIGLTKLFYAPVAETRNELSKREKAAKSICSMCNVRVECLNYALDNDEKYGLWGGLSEDERHIMVRGNTRRRR